MEGLSWNPLYDNLYAPNLPCSLFRFVHHYLHGGFLQNVQKEMDLTSIYIVKEVCMCFPRGYKNNLYPLSCLCHSRHNHAFEISPDQCMSLVLIPESSSRRGSSGPPLGQGSNMWMDNRERGGDHLSDHPHPGGHLSRPTPPAPPSSWLPLITGCHGNTCGTFPPPHYQSHVIVPWPAGSGHVACGHDVPSPKHTPPSPCTVLFMTPHGIHISYPDPLPPRWGSLLLWSSHNGVTPCSSSKWRTFFKWPSSSMGWHCGVLNERIWLWRISVTLSVMFSLDSVGLSSWM